MLKLLCKIIAVPMVILFTVLYYIMYGAARVYCRVAGTVYVFIGICIFLAIITKQWLNLEIFGILAGAGLLILIAAGWLLGSFDSGREYFKGKLSA